MAESKEKQIVLISELPRIATEATRVIAKKKPKLEIATDFTPKHKKFVLDESIDSLTMNFNDFKLAANVFNDSDKTFAEFLKSLELGTQSIPNFEFKIKPEQISIENSRQVNVLSEGITGNKQNIDAEKNICYQVGPFLEEKKLIDWIKINNIDKDAVTRFNQELKKLSNYLVYYPRAETYALSKNNSQVFEKKGIKDYWLFAEGELKGVYSLGLLKNKNRALQLQKTLAKKGLNTEIMPRYKLEKLWFAKILSRKRITAQTVTISDKQSLSLCDNI
jgi:hypothetical protein